MVALGGLLGGGSSIMVIVRAVDDVTKPLEKMSNSGSKFERSMTKLGFTSKAGFIATSLAITAAVIPLFKFGSEVAKAAQATDELTIASGRWSVAWESISSGPGQAVANVLEKITRVMVGDAMNTYINDNKNLIKQLKDVSNEYKGINLQMELLEARRAKLTKPSKQEMKLKETLARGKLGEAFIEQRRAELLLKKEGLHVEGATSQKEIDAVAMKKDEIDAELRQLDITHQRVEANNDVTSANLKALESVNAVTDATFKATDEWIAARDSVLDYKEALIELEIAAYTQAEAKEVAKLAALWEKAWKFKALFGGASMTYIFGVGGDGSTNQDIKNEV